MRNLDLFLIDYIIRKEELVDFNAVNNEEKIKLNDIIILSQTRRPGQKCYLLLIITLLHCVFDKT